MCRFCCSFNQKDWEWDHEAAQKAKKKNDSKEDFSLNFLRGDVRSGYKTLAANMNGLLKWAPVGPNQMASQLFK